jgi:hypothetical protein
MIMTLELAAKKRRHHNDERNSEDGTNVDDEMSGFVVVRLYGSIHGAMPGTV